MIEEMYVNLAFRSLPEVRQKQLREVDARIAVACFGFRWFRWGESPHADGAIPVFLSPPKDSLWRGRWSSFLLSSDRDITGSESDYRRSNDWDFSLPYFSTDLADARLVWNWLRDQGYLVVVKEMPAGQFFRTNDSGSDLPGVSAVCELHGFVTSTQPQRVNGYSDIVEAAICDAALTFVRQRQ